MAGLLFLLLAFASGSCKTWNPNRIYKADDSYGYDSLTFDFDSAYRIVEGDRLELLLYTNNGVKMVDAGLSGETTVQIINQGLSYLVNKDGYCNFPLINEVNVSGLTVEVLEDTLERLYDDHIVDPWVQLNVINRRAIVYRGDGEATVVPLINEYMTIFEVIAAAGGIPSRSKAYDIRLIRGGGDQPEVFTLNLRDVETAVYGNVVVQASDVIIIDDTFETSFLTQLLPVITVITSVAALITIISRL